MNDFPSAVPSEASSKKRAALWPKALTLLLALFLLGTSFWFGFERGRSAAFEADLPAISPEDAIFINKENRESTIDFGLFWKVWAVLKDKYVDKENLDARKLFYGAIDGMLAATGDPYTTFFSPEENQEFKEDISGTFEGIGAELGMRDNVPTVIAPLEGTPAEAAGILPGDKILRVNDESTSGLSLDETVDKIRGPEGSEVTLNIYREGDEEARDIVIKRGVIVVKSVRFEMKENGIAYIRLSRFGDDTVRDFTAAARQARENGAQSLVLDLRNNPGGYLEGAVEIGSLMLPENKVVVLEEDGHGKRTEMKTKGGDILSHLPTVVLINEGSASASEILSGALRDNRENVTLVGRTSFGKGSVQELISVGRNTAVKVTVARWLTPNGDQINEVGITPDREVRLSAEDRGAGKDPQLDEAVKILSGN